MESQRSTASYKRCRAAKSWLRKQKGIIVRRMATSSSNSSKFDTLFITFITGRAFEQKTSGMVANRQDEVSRKVLRGAGRKSSTSTVKFSITCVRILSEIKWFNFTSVSRVSWEFFKDHVGPKGIGKGASHQIPSCIVGVEKVLLRSNLIMQSELLSSATAWHFVKRAKKWKFSLSAHNYKWGPYCL